ncbi:hypothetical protein V6R86_09270 [Sphingomonas kaistensis]|jgi:hypothetical protein|uniref:Uncharacterized protein n=1 Tax=Sphingomonas kaistensis TaxID=298708 RepID=A0ABZ2G174_9SPHN
MSIADRQPVNEAANQQAPAEEALALTQQAIGICDGADLPGDIAAHLDLAAHRLREFIGLKQGGPASMTAH